MSPAKWDPVCPGLSVLTEYETYLDISRWHINTTNAGTLESFN